MRGHKRGCRCVGCSAATRARGMAALRRRSGGQSSGSRHNAQPARPPGKPSRLSMKEAARRAGQDAGNRSMRKAGRKKWSQADWNAATREYHRVLGTDLAEGNPLTRSETTRVLREHRYYEALARKSSIPRRSYLVGMADATLAVARKFGVRPPAARRPEKIRTRVDPYRENPGGKRNLPRRMVGRIPGVLTRVEYRRAGKHPGQYYHKFGRDVRAFALADGSILLKGPRRLYVRH
jgi:hypothetical protein